MALLIVTILGFAFTFGITAVFMIHYMKDSLVSHDAETIDPKPDVTY